MLVAVGFVDTGLVARFAGPESAQEATSFASRAPDSFDLIAPPRVGFCGIMDEVGLSYTVRRLSVSSRIVPSKKRRNRWRR